MTFCDEFFMLVYKCECSFESFDSMSAIYITVLYWNKDMKF